MSERVIQREGRWKSGANKVYTRNNKEDISQVSRKSADAGWGLRDNPARIRSGENCEVSEGPRI